jgi:UDP-glucose 4-epimerase
VYARLFHAQYACPVVVLRVTMVYGPEQPDRTRLVPYAAQFFLDGSPPKLSGGTRLVDWVYVDDVVEAHLTAASAPEAVGRSLDVGSGSPVTICEIVARLAKCVGTSVVPTFGALPDRPLEQPLVTHVEETHRLLGWRATTTLDEGLRRTEWLRAEQREAASPDVSNGRGGRRP